VTNLLLAALLAIPGGAQVHSIPRLTPSVSALPRLPLLATPGTTPHAALTALNLTPSLLPSAPIAVAPAPIPDQAAPLGALFDGEAGRDEQPVSASDLSTWLSISDAKTAEALDAAAELANQTKIGRRILWEAAKLLQSSPLPVDVLDLGKNHGEYDYLDTRLRLHQKLLRPENRAILAATMIHELRHVTQHALGIPAESLEMEIEAHLDDLACMAELGVTPPEKTFARQSWEALKKGPEAFAELLAVALPGRPRLTSSTYARIEEELEEQLEDARRGKSARKKKLAAAIERDLDLIRSKEGRAAYRAFSRRVEARLRRDAAAAAQP
jgi:hypothetical protein